MRPKTDPNTGITTAVLTDADRSLLARAKDLLLQIAWQESPNNAETFCYQGAQAIAEVLKGNKEPDDVAE